MADVTITPGTCLGGTPLGLDSSTSQFHVLGFATGTVAGVPDADYWVFNTNMVFAHGPTSQLAPRLVITAAGNVGVGVAKPATALDVAGTVTATGLILNGGDGAAGLDLTKVGPLTLNGQGLAFQNIQQSRNFQGDVYNLQQLMVDPSTGQVFYQ